MAIAVFIQNGNALKFWSDLEMHVPPVKGSLMILKEGIDEDVYEVLDVIYRPTGTNTASVIVEEITPKRKFNFELMSKRKEF